MYTLDHTSFPDAFVENVELVLRKDKLAAISTLSVGAVDGLQSYQITFSPMEGGVIDVVEDHLRLGDALDTEAVCAFVKTRYKYIRPSMLLEVLELVGTYTQCEEYIAASLGNTLMVTIGHYVLAYANEVDDPFGKVITRSEKANNVKYN